MMADRSANIAVIGAGIIGLSCAERLSRSTDGVVVVDPAPPGRMTSWGNMGAMAFGEVIPMARPAMIAQAARWLVDPLGPVAISKRGMLQNLAWFRRFAAAAFDNGLDARVEALTRLNALSEEIWEEVLGDTPLWERCNLGRVQHVYDLRVSFEKDAALWEIRERAGHPHRVLAGYESGYGGVAVPAAGIAIATPSWRLTPDPYLLSRKLEEMSLSRGTEIVVDEIMSLEARGDDIVLKCKQGDISCRTVVVAAGARSDRIAKRIGDTVPVIAERGYSYTVPPHDHGVAQYTVFRSHGFVVAPLECGLRIGGSAEFVRPDAPPNWRRLDVILDKAKRFLPHVDLSGGQRWYGDRPSTPDSLPVIGRSPRSNNIIYAVGHGHLGVTQAAATGRLVSDLIEGSLPSIDMLPFSPGRFG